MSLIDSVKHICNTLAFFGIKTLNPEAIRQASLNNPSVVRNKQADRF